MANKYPKRSRVVETMGNLFAGLEDRAELELLDRLQPKVRGDCAAARAAIYADLPDDNVTKQAAPCPWLRCKYHLHMDVEPTVQDGNDCDRITHYESSPSEWTCVLDAVEKLAAAIPSGLSDEGVYVADDAPSTIEEEMVDPKMRLNSLGEQARGENTDRAMSAMLGESDEWVRKTWNKALEKLRVPLIRLSARRKPIRRLEVVR